MEPSVKGIVFKWFHTIAIYGKKKKQNKKKKKKQQKNKQKKKQQKTNLRIFFSRTKKTLRLNLGIQHWGLKVYQVYSDDEPKMTFLWHGQICIPIQNCEKSISKNVFKSNVWNWQ